MLGEGVVKGLIETARNFVGSYQDPERLTTVQYPEQRLAPKENARTIPFLVFDEAGIRCTSCQICEKECPPQCIYIVKDPTKKPDYVARLQFQPKIFDIDISVCMSCGICAEVCPFDAIKMDQVFELSTEDRFGALLIHKEELLKSAEYFKEIQPTIATEIDATREEDKRKAAAKVKADAEAKAKAAAPKPPAPAAPAVPNAPNAPTAPALPPPPS